MRCAIGGGGESSAAAYKKLRETFQCVEYHYVSPDIGAFKEVLAQLKTNGMKPIYDIEMAVWVNSAKKLGIDPQTTIAEHKDKILKMNVNADITWMRPQLKNIKDAGWEGFSSEGISQKQVSVLMEFLPYYNYGGEGGEDVYANGSMYYRPRSMAFANYHECYHRGVNYTPAIMSGNKSTPKHMGLTLMLYTTGELYSPDPQPLINYIDSLKGAGVNIDTTLFWVGVGQSALMKLEGQFNYLWTALHKKYDFGSDHVEPEPPAPNTPTKITTFIVPVSKNAIDIDGQVLDANKKPIDKQKVVLYQDYAGQINNPIGDTLTNNIGQFYFAPRDIPAGMHVYKVKAGSVLVTAGRVFIRA